MKKIVDNNGIPRRNRLDLNFPIETEVYNLVMQIERMPANVHLTEAQVLLQQAKNKISDYYDYQLHTQAE